MGAAGFLGCEIFKKILSKGFQVLLIDNFNSYHNPYLKEKRIKTIEEINQNILWNFWKINLDEKKIDKIFRKYKPNIVINFDA